MSQTGPCLFGQGSPLGAQRHWVPRDRSSNPGGVENLSSFDFES